MLQKTSEFSIGKNDLTSSTSKWQGESEKRRTVDVKRLQIH